MESFASLVLLLYPSVLFFALALGPASLITADDRGRVAVYDLDQGKPKLKGRVLIWDGPWVSVTPVSLRHGDGLVDCQDIPAGYIY